MSKLVTKTVVLIAVLIAITFSCTGGVVLKNNGAAARPRVETMGTLSYNEVGMKSSAFKYIKDEKSFFNLKVSPTSVDDSQRSHTVYPYNTLKI